MKRHHRMSKLVLAAITAAAITGCSATTGHDENMADATARWNSVRSGSMAKMAEQQFEAGDLDRAEETLASAIAIDQGNPYLHLLAGRVALERGQLERSYNRLERAVSAQGGLRMPDAHYYRGIVLQRWNQFDKALEAYRQAYELAPDHAGYLLAMGEMLVAMDRIDEAMQLLQDRAAYFDQSAGLHAAIGHLHIIRGEKTEAVAELMQASVLAPEDAQILEDLALAELSTGQFDEAIQHLKTLNLLPGMAARRDTRQMLAGAYLAANRPADAMSVYVKMTRKDPEDVEAWVSLGQLAWDRGDTRGAMTAAGHVRVLDANRPEGHLMAGMVWYKRGDLDRAVDLFTLAAERSPKSAGPLLLKGIALEQQGKTEEAAAVYAEALKREPQDTRARRLLASVSGLK